MLSAELAGGSGGPGGLAGGLVCGGLPAELLHPENDARINAPAIPAQIERLRTKNIAPLVNEGSAANKFSSS